MFSADMFLEFLLSLLPVSGGFVEKLVKVLMGRISVKINPNKLAQLNEYGVYHLASLLLSIASLVPEDPSPQQIAGQLLKVRTSILEIKNR